MIRMIEPKGQDLEKAICTSSIKLLIKENKITQAVAESMKQWEHSGFHIYCDEPFSRVRGISN